MSDSFDSVMAEMRDKAKSKYWKVMANLLNAAHERELEHVRQESYHRGYEDGLHARNTATWQLNQERREVVRRLRESIDPDYREYPEFFADALIQELGLDVDANFCDVRRRIIHLLGGENELETDPISPESVENLREAEKEGGEATQFTTMVTTKTSNLRLDKDLAICGIEPKARISDEPCEPNLSKSPNMTNKTSIDGTATNHDGTRPNTVQSASITAELRDEFQTCVAEGWMTAERAALLADNIDAEFAKLAYERNHFEHERDYWHQVATNAMNHADEMERECDVDALVAKLREAIDGGR